MARLVKPEAAAFHEANLTKKSYYIPLGSDSEETRLNAAIDAGYSLFLATFFDGVAPEATDDIDEAARLFIFSEILASEMTFNGADGAGYQHIKKDAALKLNFKKIITAYNEACQLLQRKDKKLRPFINF